MPKLSRIYSLSPAVAAVKNETLPPPNTWALIDTILRRGDTVELKRVGGQLHIVEIRRTIKERVTLATGQADG